MLEAGDNVGHAVWQWSHVRMFSPWSYNIDKAAEASLREAGWNSPEQGHHPTGSELVAHYLEPLTTRTKLNVHIQTNARVVSVGAWALTRSRPRAGKCTLWRTELGKVFAQLVGAGGVRKSYGRAPTFLMMRGYEQVRSIIADIAGDREAAERVELVLPDTGRL